MRTRGREGVQNAENFADVIYGRPQRARGKWEAGTAGIMTRKRTGPGTEPRDPAIGCVIPRAKIAKSGGADCKEGGGEGIRVRSRATIARNDVACLKQGCCRRRCMEGHERGKGKKARVPRRLWLLMLSFQLSTRSKSNTQICKFMSKNLKFSPEILLDGEGKHAR